MAQTAIFGPFFATMLLTLLVWVYKYIRRISFITKNNISPKDLAVPGALAQLSPAAVSNPSDNLKNLFEIPVLICSRFRCSSMRSFSISSSRVKWTPPI
jgi:hypothetical protein